MYVFLSSFLNMNVRSRRGLCIVGNVPRCLMIARLATAMVIAPGL